jgi:tetratricopeptide (TPR) repeat protein
MLLLERAIARNPKDARAPYYLGNLLYDRRRYQEAIAHWERATSLDPSFPTAWRNLGFGYFNVLHEDGHALGAFENAHRLAPGDARILYERDQLLRRTGASPEHRLAILESQRALVDQRDDLSVEMASLYNSTERPEKALDILLNRQFQPWEGGEGLVLSEFVRANVLLAIHSLRNRVPARALEYLQAASNPPENLAEAKHLLMNLSVIDYWLGESYAAIGNTGASTAHWQRAASTRGDFQQMQVQPVSETTYWSALALRRLGRGEEARGLFEHIREYAHALDNQTPKIDYFATSLPALLLFDEDLKKRQTVTARFLEAQALLGLGNERAGVALLTEVCAMDNSYAAAIDLLKNRGN